MAAHSYLIFGPNGPTDIAKAQIRQRQTIPLAWALAFGSHNAKLVNEDNGTAYLENTVDDALVLLDKCTSSWNYNSYFRDVLSPIGIFRTWLAKFPPSTKMYINITELLKRSPSRSRDLEALATMPDALQIALDEVSQRNFTGFVQELRKISYPFITVPITGNRTVDIKILTFEMRDAESIEEEMALQMIGVDRDQTLLEAATKAVQIRRPEAATLKSESLLENPVVLGKATMLRLFTSDMEAARHLFAHEMGCEVMREARDYLVLDAHGREFEVLHISEPSLNEIFPEDEG